MKPAARVVGLALDLGAPVLLSAAATHELLYNDAAPGMWVLTLAAVWPLAWRRRAPLGVLGACLALALVLWARDTSSVAQLSPLVALYTVASARGLRSAAVAAAVVEVGAVLVAVRFAPTGSVNDAVILLSGLVAATLFLGTTVRAQRRYLASVEDRARRLEHERVQQAQLAAAEERTRIAREMHDIVAHGLSVVITLAQGAAVAVAEDPAGATRAMEQAAAAGRQSLDEMRRLLQVLRTDDRTEREPQPGLTGLDALVAEVRRTGLTVHVVSHGDTDLVDATGQATVYRIVQEALTNVLKHAGRATEVTVTVDVDASGVRFAVEDDGGPPRAAGVGNGLTGMRERVALFGGVLDSGPSATGWRISGRLPVGRVPA